MKWEGKARLYISEGKKKIGILAKLEKYRCNGRKRRGTKEPLDEDEGGE